jgi:hypothetical protein
MAAHVARLGIVPGLFCGGGIHGRIVYSGIGGPDTATAIQSAI